MTTANVPSTADRLAELIEFLPAFMRAGEGHEALERMLEPWAKSDRLLALKREGLVDLVDETAIREDLVRFLAANVGWDRAFSASAALSTADLRKLIPVAVHLWKRVGTRSSLRTAVAAMAGSRALVLDWFHLRWVTGTARAVHVIPGPSAAGFPPYSYPEHVTDLWFMDPLDVVRDAPLERVLDVVRGSGERLNLRRALLLDDLLNGEGFWTRTGAGTSHTYAEVTDAGVAGHELQVSDGDGYYADLDGASDAFAGYRASFRMPVTGVAEIDALVESGEGTTDDCYRLEIDQAGGQVEIIRRDAGSPTSLGTAAVVLMAGYGYDYSFDLIPGGSSTTVRIWREGVLELEVIDTHANRKTAGGLAWRAATGSSNVVSLRSALVFEEGVAMTRVGPNP